MSSWVLWIKGGLCLGGWLVWVGTRDDCEGGREGGVLEWYRRRSFILSYWSRANEVTWGNEMGWKACTSRRISGLRLEMK